MDPSVSQVRMLEPGDKKDMTDSGAIPNSRAARSNDMTPKKKETLALVRTTFADCHELASVVIRVDICN